LCDHAVERRIITVISRHLWAGRKEEEMRLTERDRKMLEGKEGKAASEAMAFLVKLGEAFEAEELVDVDSVHLGGDWTTSGEAALQLYRRFVDGGGRLKVHSSREPIGFDTSRFNEFNLPKEQYIKDMEFKELLTKLGCVITYTCIPYLSQNIPRFGDNLAWVEGNATGYANSVLGARGNRESVITCVMAGITGRIPKHGLLREENRRAQILIEIDRKVVESIEAAGAVSSDFSALGMIIGDIAFDKIPAVVGLPRKMKIEQLKAFVSMCSPALTTTLALMVGISPEAPSLEAAFGGRIPDHVERKRITLEDLREGYKSLSRSPKDQVNAVLTGCPFKTVYELQELADMLKGKQIKDGVSMWVYTDRTNWEMAESTGVRERIESSGARLFHDACPVILPHRELFGPDKVFATDSMKLVRLTRGLGKPAFLFGTIQDLIKAATTGRFTSNRW
jgi:predicted aconitase